MTRSPGLAAEEALVGSALLDEHACRDLLAIPEEFLQSEVHRAITRAIRASVNGHMPPDVVTVREALLRDDDVRGVDAELNRVMEAVPTAANWQTYRPIILKAARDRDEARLRDRIKTAEPGLAQDRAVEDLKNFLLAEKEAQTPVAAPFLPMGAFDLLNTTLPRVEELVAPRIIYRGGVTVLVASHKRGKSLASLALCADLVINITTPIEQRFGPDCVKWLGQDIVGAGPVLVYSAEGGPRMVQDRLRKMIPNAGEWLNDLKVYAKKPTPQLDQKAHLAAVFAHAEAVGAVLLVFDPLGRFWAMEDEGDPTAARNLMEAIQAHAEAAYDGRGIAVLVIHHDTKEKGGDPDAPVSGGRGSGKFGDDADALINLKLGAKGAPAGQSKAMFLLRHAESPAPVTVQIDPDTLRLRVLSEDEAAASTTKQGRPPKTSLAALASLIRTKKRIIASEIADHLGISFGTWKNLRREMLRDLVETGEFAVDAEPGTAREVVIHLGHETHR